jgi:hypothetical protein
MCFSAEASFAAGAALLPAGLYCVRSALRKDRRFLALASIPILFGVQQSCEGLVWVGLERGDLPLTKGAALLFLFFALFFWPFWVPFSVAFVDPRKPVRQMLSVLALLGLAFGWTLYAPAVIDSERLLRVRVMHHSIRYDVFTLPAFDRVPAEAWQLAYLAAICCPFLVSLNRQFRLFALTLAASGVISHLVFRYAFESVWCFFAAALSLQLSYAFRELRAPGEEPHVRPLAPS